MRHAIRCAGMAALVGSAMLAAGCAGPGRGLLVAVPDAAAGQRRTILAVTTRSPAAQRASFWRHTAGICLTGPGSRRNRWAAFS